MMGWLQKLSASLLALGFGIQFATAQEAREGVGDRELEAGVGAEQSQPPDRQAHARGVPVLSLRMLGSLTDERSCANSRFFRTFLYTDPALAKLMTESFVLHWSSERPVPQVEIDYGDGRVLRTTTTGNSAHYILDGDGRVLDVLPGLYDARTFESQLQGALELHAALDRDPKHRDRLLRAYHRDGKTG